MKYILILFFSTALAISVYGQDDENIAMPTSPSKLYKKGLNAYEAQDYFLSKKYFDALRDIGFGSDEEKLDHVKLCYKLGDYTQANKYIDELNKSKCRLPLFYYYFVLLRHQEGKEERSERLHPVFFEKCQFSDRISCRDKTFG